MNSTKWQARDMAALNGNTVTEGHAQYCRDNGHAKHTIDREIQDRCPRCGELRETQEHAKGTGTAQRVIRMVGRRTKRPVDRIILSGATIESVQFAENIPHEYRALAGDEYFMSIKAGSETFPVDMSRDHMAERQPSAGDVIEIEIDADMTETWEGYFHVGYSATLRYS